MSSDQLIAECLSCGKKTYREGGFYDRCILHNPFCKNPKLLKIYDPKAVGEISNDKTIETLNILFDEEQSGES